METPQLHSNMSSTYPRSTQIYLLIDSLELETLFYLMEGSPIYFTVPMLPPSQKLKVTA